MKWDDWEPQHPRLKEMFQLWRDGELYQAELAFQCAVEKHDQEPDAWRGLGSVLWSLGRFEDAASAFRRAIALDYWNPMHWHNLGLTFRELGKPDPAIRMLRFAAALDPGYEPAINEWANVLVDRGQLEQALDLYDRALVLDDSRAVVHHNRGVCLRLLGDLANAESSFAQALRLEPGYRHTLQELERISTQNIGNLRPDHRS